MWNFINKAIWAIATAILTVVFVHYYINLTPQLHNKEESLPAFTLENEDFFNDLVKKTIMVGDYPWYFRSITTINNKEVRYIKRESSDLVIAYISFKDTHTESKDVLAGIFGLYYQYIPSDYSDSGTWYLKQIEPIQISLDLAPVKNKPAQPKDSPPKKDLKSKSQSSEVLSPK